MAALARERDLAALGQVEVHAEAPGARASASGASPTTARTTSSSHSPWPDDERVGEVQLDAVGLADRAGDAALRVPGVRLGEARPW